jgi:hypothetical protein
MALAAVAALGAGTGCEKQSPYVTFTAHGVTVKARATKYCREKRCNESKENPILYVTSGDVLGIDVPRSLADQGWRIETGQESPYSHDHYRSIPLGTQFQPGAEVPVTITRDKKYGDGVWNFTLRVR